MRLSSADRMLYRKERKNCPLGLSTFGFDALQRYGNRGISRMRRQQHTQGVLVSPVAPLGLCSQCLLGVVQVKMRGVYSITFRASHVLGIWAVFEVEMKDWRRVPQSVEESGLSPVRQPKAHITNGEHKKSPGSGAWDRRSRLHSELS
jgi:hypothetical protein